MLLLSSVARSRLVTLSVSYLSVCVPSGASILDAGAASLVDAAAATTAWDPSLSPFGLHSQRWPPPLITASVGSWLSQLFE